MLLKIVAVLALSASLFVGVSGCGSSSSTTGSTVSNTINNVIANLTPASIENDTHLGYFGSLTVLNTVNPTLANTIATQTVNQVTNIILPFLKGGIGQDAAVVEKFITDNFLSKLPDQTWVNTINAAESILNPILGVALPGSFMTAVQVADLSALFQGFVDGANDLLANAPAPKSIIQRTTAGLWFRPAATKKA